MSWCLVSLYALRMSIVIHRYMALISMCSGVGMMIHSRGTDGSDVELVFTQILQGLGGGLAAISSQVGAQAAVPHADVAITTALVLLLTEIGGAVGNACGGYRIQTGFSSHLLWSFVKPVQSGQTRCLEIWKSTCHG